MKKTLMIVDDDSQLLIILKNILILDDYKIFTAKNGDEALEILTQNLVHVVLTDYRMPGMNGAELLAKVKEQHPEIIRLIVTGYADFDVIKDSVNNGAIYKFITKPWENELLRQTIQEAFELFSLQNKHKYIDLGDSLISDTDIQFALDENQFEVYYQPFINGVTEEIVGAEALLRWRHPIKGLLLPKQFISLCEDSKLIIPIGIWVLRTACRQLKQWHNAGHENLSIAINLSTCQFNHPGFLDVIKKTLSETQLPPNSLELEITESLIMENIDRNIDQLMALKTLGVKISLDDFGTGFSSLSYLAKFPVDILKIDISFVQEITTKKSILEIVSMTIALAKKLKLTTIAEGVETREQLELLKEKQCDLIQGYLFSKPVTHAEFTQLLDKAM